VSAGDHSYCVCCPLAAPLSLNKTNGINDVSWSTDDVTPRPGIILTRGPLLVLSNGRIVSRGRSIQVIQWLGRDYFEFYFYLFTQRTHEIRFHFMQKHTIQEHCSYALNRYLYTVSKKNKASRELFSIILVRTNKLLKNLEHLYLNSLRTQVQWHFQ